MCKSGFKEKLDVKDEEITSAKIRLLEHGEKSNIFRGKNQFDFMTKYIEQLYQGRKELFDPVPKNIKITPNQNRLSTFSMYAQTPECLETFLQAHKSKKLVVC